MLSEMNVRCGKLRRKQDGDARRRTKNVVRAIKCGVGGNRCFAEATTPPECAECDRPDGGVKRVRHGDAPAEAGKMLNGDWSARCFLVPGALFVGRSAREVDPRVILPMPRRVVDQVPTANA